MNDRPRGGMNTSLVEYSSTMSPGAYWVATASGAAGGLAASASSGIIAPAAPAAPTTLSQSRRETESDTQPHAKRYVQLYRTTTRFHLESPTSPDPRRDRSRRWSCRRWV